MGVEVHIKVCLLVAAAHCRMLLLLSYGVLFFLCSCNCLSLQKRAKSFLPAVLVAGGLGFSIPSQQAMAFDNAVKVVKTPKTKGPQPRTGLDKDGNVAFCGKPSPNCFSTTSDEIDGEDFPDEHAIPRWKYKGTPDEAFVKIGDTLRAYPPGHDDIDGGGFKIITADEAKRYYYVQYESLRRGFIDDVEIAISSTDNTIQARSASRMGYLDFEVNAKRLNYIGNR